MASEPTTRPFTVEEYYWMAEAGILVKDDRVAQTADKLSVATLPAVVVQAGELLP